MGPGLTWGHVHFADAGYEGILPGCVLTTASGQILGALLVEDSLFSPAAQRGKPLALQVWQFAMASSLFLGLVEVVGSQFTSFLLARWVFIVAALATIWFVSDCEARRTLNQYERPSLGRRCSAFLGGVDTQSRRA